MQRVLFNSFRIRFYLGLFDPIENQPYLKYNETSIGSTEGRQLALDSARQSGVLLKNSGVLPFASTDSVAVIGPNGNSTTVLIGNYASASLLCADKTQTCYNNIAQVRAPPLLSRARLDPLAGDCRDLPWLCLRNGVRH